MREAPPGAVRRSELRGNGGETEMFRRGKRERSGDSAPQFPVRHVSALRENLLESVRVKIPRTTRTFRLDQHVLLPSVPRGFRLPGELQEAHGGGAQRPKLIIFFVI